MTYGFWKNLPKPIFALAPMHDVTDAAFRNIIAKYGKPDVFYTEFASTDGLTNDIGRSKLMHYLNFSKAEHPIVAQVFGSNPQKFEEVAKLVADLGFDGIDINMGCPEKNAVKGGSCAGLFHTPDLAKEIILACKRGAPNIPTSIKIRIGDTKVDWQNWISKLLEAEPAAIAIHLRTRKEMSKVPAHWEEMPKIVKFIQDNTTEETRPIILGNGDVMTIAEAAEKVAATGCDGVMLGRAIFGNPWLFAKNLASLPTLEERLKVLVEHCKLYEETFTGIKPWDVMKRHFKAYVAGFENAGEVRAQLYETKNAHDVKIVVNAFLKTL
jgi:nifR3 family TIM-barrel protein